MRKRPFYSEQNIWIWQRITGLLLVLGVAVHLFITHIQLTWPIRLRDVHERIQHPLWVVFDCILLLISVYHGLTGVWIVFTDRNPSRSFKISFKFLLIVIGIGLSVMGIFNIIAMTR